MNLRQLTYFVTVARERNFTRAASICRVAQPALSQQIRKLEEELGVELIERSRRGVTLTRPGVCFLSYAERILQLLSEGKHRVADMRELRFGVVTVMCTPTVATYWLPRSIQRYRELFPDVEIRIIEQPGCTPEDMGRSVADVGIVQTLEAERHGGSGMVSVERLFRDELVLVCRANHPLAQAGQGSHTAPVPLGSLAGEAFVLPKQPCGMTRVIMKAFADAKVEPKVTLETSQVEAIFEMVAAGLGVGFMPRMAMHRAYPGLIWRRLKNPTPVRDIGLATFVDRPLSAVASAFVEVLREAADPASARSPTITSRYQINTEGVLDS